MRPHIILIGILALSIFAPAHTLGQAFNVGSNGVNLGIGLGGYRYGYLTGLSNNYSVSPTLALSYERGVTEVGPGVLGIGGFFARKSVNYRHVSNGYYYTYNYDQRWSNTIIGLRGSWHLNDWHGSDRFDVYGGIMIGYNIGSYRDKSTRTYNGTTEPYTDNYWYNLSFVTYSTYIGGRYLFTDRVGAYLELGYGVAYLNLGATVII